jgi:hypothetical protein
MATLRAKISPDGSKVKIEVEGIAGESCLSTTEALEKAIFGDGRVDRNLTDEYYQEPEIGVNV